MTRRKGDGGRDKSGERRAGGGKRSPTVATFLSKISTPKGQAGANSPAKGLLGEITRADLVAVGRLQAGDDGAAALAAPAPSLEDAASAMQETSQRIEMTLPTLEGGPAVGLSTQSGRRQERLAWRSVVDVRGVLDGSVAGDPFTRDMSMGGVFIETAHLLEVGDPVVLSFPLEDGKRIVVNGRVRWVTPFGRVDDPTPGMGVEFVGVDPSRRERISSLLAKRRS
ncbi:MAG: hypothetical protein FJ137_09085 [Deltaproteobacteria bacterium]|nr:hypothetical protein [Deltaproteobacteria bacterium]